MSDPKWILMSNQGSGLPDVVFREWPDGRQESCLVTTDEYLAWVAEGNSPLPWPPVS